jgi:hypothetical protein
LYNNDGSIAQARTTAGVYEIVAGSGMYASYITFLDSFHGSVAWDTGEGANSAFAVEQYNVEENDPKVGAIYTDVRFIKSVEGGRWRIDTATNQMVFYAEDNVTMVATFNLFDQNGAPTSSSPYERQRA